MANYSCFPKEVPKSGGVQERASPNCALTQ